MRLMGVTIHFEGRLQSEAAYTRCIQNTLAFAAVRGWRVEPIEPAERTLHRVRNDEDLDYSGPTRGVCVLAHDDAERLRLEFDRDLYVQEYVKTQFAPIDVHVAIVELLSQLAPEFEELSVEDEGEYWGTRDRSLLERHISSCFAAMDDAIAADPTLSGPFRMPSGRIADLVR